MKMKQRATSHNPRETRDKGRATSRERRATRDERRATSDERRATSRERPAASDDCKAQVADRLPLTAGRRPSSVVRQLGVSEPRNLGFSECQDLESVL